MPLRTRTDNIGIASLMIIIVSGVWIFGFADDVYSVFQINLDAIPEKEFDETSERTEFSNVADDLQKIL